MQIIEKSLMDYREADSWQRELLEARVSGKIPDTLLLLEHPPVITQGQRDAKQELRVPLTVLEESGIAFVETDRGGKLTYHGPGQLIGYFIFALGSRTIPEFVHWVEESVIRVLQSYGVTGERDPKYPGVWVHQRKIAALGLHFERGISRHGFALNVNCDLKPFGLFYPCGIRDRETTSLAAELGREVSLSGVRRRVIATIQDLASNRRG